MSDKIKEISTKLLKEKTVEMVIGFRKGTLPMMNEPCFAENTEDIQSFVWDSNCGINLANYLTDRKEKIGIVAKGCDSRNIVTHIIENKIDRDQLFIIGVPCKGMIDRKKISDMFDVKTVKAIKWSPEAQCAVVTVGSANVEEQRNESALWLYRHSDHSFRQITHGPADSAADWLDKDTILFTASKRDPKAEEADKPFAKTRFYTMSIWGDSSSIH